MFNGIPLWYGLSASINKNIMFIPILQELYRFTLDADSLELIEESGIKKATNSNYDLNIKTVFVINPKNSTDWSTDHSCFLKSVTKAAILGEIVTISSFALDKYDFNLNGQYCDTPSYFEGDPNSQQSSFLIDENTLGGKYNLATNYYHLVF